MGGDADFKVGYKTGFASGASEKKKRCTHTFPNVGYKQTNISRGLLTRVRGVEIQSLVQY